MLNIKFKKIELVIVALILLFAAFLYTYKLGSNPPGLYLDEIGTGYNAYSILKTGKDEYGKIFPLAFRLFGSYTPPLYIYLSVPIMAVLGLSIFSTRLLSVICGILATIIIFLLIKELKITKSKLTPLIASLFFIITPWTVFFSRMGYEQNLAFLFFSISALLIIKTLNNPKLLMLAIPFISLTTYTDYPQRLLAPLLFIGSSILFWKNFKTMFLQNKKNIKYAFIGIVIAALIQIPNIFLLTTPSTYTKSDHFYLDVVVSQSKKIEHFLPKVVSIPLSFLREFSSQYITYFSPRSLFFLPDDDLQRSMPELSVFYSWMIVPYLIGLYIAFRKKDQPFIKFIILLLLISPLPGALTRQPFHVQRTLSLLLPLTLIMAIGIDRFILKITPKISVLLFIFLFFSSLLFLWRSYFVLLPKIRSSVWAFQFQKLADYIKLHPNEKFIIDQGTRTRPQDIAYIQLAFYLQIPPEELQKDQNPGIVKNYYTDTNFSFIHKFANIETKQIDWGESVYENATFVGDIASISDPEAKLHSLTKVFEILDPNDEIVLRGFKSNPQ